MQHKNVINSDVNASTHTLSDAQEQVVGAVLCELLQIETKMYEALADEKEIDKHYSLSNQCLSLAFTACKLLEKANLYDGKLKQFLEIKKINYNQIKILTLKTQTSHFSNKTFGSLQEVEASIEKMKELHRAELEYLTDITKLTHKNETQQDLTDNADYYYALIHSSFIDYITYIMENQLINFEPFKKGLNLNDSKFLSTLVGIRERVTELELEHRERFHQHPPHTDLFKTNVKSYIDRLLHKTLLLMNVFSVKGTEDDVINIGKKLAKAVFLKQTYFKTNGDYFGIFSQLHKTFGMIKSKITNLSLAHEIDFLIFMFINKNPLKDFVLVDWHVEPHSKLSEELNTIKSLLKAAQPDVVINKLDDISKYLHDEEAAIFLYNLGSIYSNINLSLYANKSYLTAKNLLDQNPHLAKQTYIPLYCNLQLMIAQLANNNYNEAQSYLDNCFELFIQNKMNIENYVECYKTDIMDSFIQLIDYQLSVNDYDNALNNASNLAVFFDYKPMQVLFGIFATKLNKILIHEQNANSFLTFISDLEKNANSNESSAVNTLLTTLKPLKKYIKKFAKSALQQAKRLSPTESPETDESKTVEKPALTEAEKAVEVRKETYKNEMAPLHEMMTAITNTFHELKKINGKVKKENLNPIAAKVESLTHAVNDLEKSIANLPNNDDIMITDSMQKLKMELQTNYKSLSDKLNSKLGKINPQTLNKPNETKSTEQNPKKKSRNEIRAENRARIEAEEKLRNERKEVVQKQLEKELEEKRQAEEEQKRIVAIKQAEELAKAEEEKRQATAEAKRLDAIKQAELAKAQEEKRQAAAEQKRIEAIKQAELAKAQEEEKNQAEVRNSLSAIVNHIEKQDNQRLLDLHSLFTNKPYVRSNKIDNHRDPKYIPDANHANKNRIIQRSNK